MERVFGRVHFRATEFHVCISGISGLRKGNTYFFDDKDVNIRPFRGILGNMFHGLCADTVDASQQDFSACLCRLKKTCMTIAKWNALMPSQCRLSIYQASFTSTKPTLFRSTLLSSILYCNTLFEVSVQARDSWAAHPDFYIDTHKHIDL